MTTRRGGLSTQSRRQLLHEAALALAALGLPAPVWAMMRDDLDEVRLADWTARLRSERVAELGGTAVWVGEPAAPHHDGAPRELPRAPGRRTLP